MLRRELLKNLSMTLALGSTGWEIPGMARPVPSFRRRRPHDAEWPSAAAWRELDQQCGHGLMPGRALLAACSPNPADQSCAATLNALNNPFFLQDQPGGTQVSGWLDAWTPAPSAFVVAAKNSADVSAAVRFAQAHRLRLVVKGAGHSYLGTSNCADSLLIWTHFMREVTVHEAFVPQGCERIIAPTPAVTAQAGAVWIDLYHAVTEQGGRYVQGGGCTDVGVAGLIQSGGFGSFSKGFGTACSGLLEAEIVTADGRVRTVNAANDPELFWALKGGGGGSWGVITKLTLRTHELPRLFGSAWGKVQARTDAAFRKLLLRFFEFYSSALLNPHWGEQVRLFPGNLFEISMVSQGLESASMQACWAPFFDWLRQSPDDFSILDNLGTHAGEARRWWDAKGQSMITDRREDAPSHHAWWKGDQEQVGSWIHGFDSVWLPSRLLQTDQRPVLVDALIRAASIKTVELHFNKGLAGAPAGALSEVPATAINPLVSEAFALAIIADGESANYPGMRRTEVHLPGARDDARRIRQAAAAIREVVGDAGSYVSESDFFNANWQREYWGQNYARLKLVKQRYDPHGLFFVHHGVGSEEWTPDGFERLA